MIKTPDIPPIGRIIVCGPVTETAPGMTAEKAFEIILKEGDHRHRLHGNATPMTRRDYIRGRLLLMIAKDAVHRAEYEAPEEPE